MSESRLSRNTACSLAYLNNRYHDPTLGGFISVDPLVVQTGEAYIYGAANPTTYSDPDGLDPQCFDSVNASCRYVNHEGKTIATRTTVRDPSTDRTTSTVSHFNISGEKVLEKVQYRGHGGGDYQEVTIGADVGAKAVIVPLTSEQGGNRGTLAVIQIGLSLGAFTPCGVYCATGAALIATYQAVDTCSGEGWGAQCGIEAGAAGLSWLGPSAHVLGTGARSTGQTSSTVASALGRGGAPVTARPSLAVWYDHPFKFLGGLPRFVGESPSFAAYSVSVRLFAIADALARVSVVASRVDVAVQALSLGLS